MCACVMGVSVWLVCLFVLQCDFCSEVDYFLIQVVQYSFAGLSSVVLSAVSVCVGVLEDCGICGYRVVEQKS